MQAVAATAGDGIIKRKLQIVVAEKPVERRPGFAAPAAVPRNTVRLQACGDSTSGLERLLIKAGLFTVLAIETLRTDRHKAALDCAPLRFRKPRQRSKPGRKR